MEDWLKSESLYECLKKNSEADYYPFHMPGHKRRGMVFENPFDWDITEIDGFDDLHHPTGILKEAMEGAASVYRSDATYFLINGSSCGILAAISASVRPGDKLLMARNCHKSVYHGALVNQLETKYLYPDILENFFCAGGITEEQVRSALRQDKEGKIRCVVITSPTYEGVVSDIRKIAETIHRHNAILIVDEAHGAHFPFHPAFPRSAIDQGADAVIQSLHKTLPSLTQTALLHIKGGRINKSRVEAYLRVYQSSSPSYVLMASIDQCIRFMAGSRGKKAMGEYVDHLRELRQELSGLKHVKLLDEKVVGSHGIYGIDPGKLILSAREAGMAGGKLYQLLRERYHLQPEMYTETAVTLMTSVNDCEQGFRRLLEAVKELDKELAKKPDIKSCRGTVHSKNYLQEFAAKLTISQAVAARSDWISLEKSPGQIAAGFVSPYPPGIPILVPGEIITDDCIQQIKVCLKQGIEVQGIQIKEARFRISVLNEM